MTVTYVSVVQRMLMCYEVKYYTLYKQIKKAKTDYQKWEKLVKKPGCEKKGRATLKSTG